MAAAEDSSSNDGYDGASVVNTLEEEDEDEDDEEEDDDEENEMVANRHKSEVPRMLDAEVVQHRRNSLQVGMNSNLNNSK